MPVKPKKKIPTDDLPVSTTDEIVEMLKPAATAHVSKLDSMLDSLDKEDEEEEIEEEDEEPDDEKEVVDEYYTLYLLDYAHKKLGLVMPGWLRETHRRNLNAKRKKGLSTDTLFTQTLLLRQLCTAPYKGGKLIDDPQVSDDQTMLLEWWEHDKEERVKMQKQYEEHAKKQKLVNRLTAKLSPDEIATLRQLGAKL